MSDDIELAYIFSLCDVGLKGYVTSEDIIKVGAEYGPELSTILNILRLRDGDRLTLCEFIRRVNESENIQNCSSLEDQDSCLSCPPSDYTSGLGSSLRAEEDFDLDVSDMRYTLRKLEDSLSIMKESQIDVKHDLSQILESVTHIDKKDINRRRIDREHETELEKMREHFVAELNRQKEFYCIQLNEKAIEIQDYKRQFSVVAEEHNKEKELLRSEVESLKLFNVVLEQKLEYLRDSHSSENSEINRQWRQIQLDKDRLEDDKIAIGFQRICVSTDSEDLKLEKNEFDRYQRSSIARNSSPFNYFNELSPNFETFQSENENLKISFEESELSNRELKKCNEELRLELFNAKSEIIELKKKMDPLSLKSGLISQFRDTLQRKKDSKSRYYDILNSERHAHLERERELLIKNDNLSAQLSEIRKRQVQSDRKKTPPPKCIITEEDKEVNKQITFEKKCLSLIIDDLKSANQNLTDNLRILEKENKKNNLQIDLEKDVHLQPKYIQKVNPRPRVFSNTSLKQPKKLTEKISSFSKSMSSLNIY
nr:MAR-binding filament-like protein 1 [Lepeophtheirus salmonis]